MINWSIRNIGNLATFHRGISWSSTQETEKPEPDCVPVLRIPNVQERLDTTSILYLRGINHDKRNRFAATRDWLLMVGSNGNPDRVGDCVRITQDTDYLFASFLVGVEPNKQAGVDPCFLYYLLRSDSVRKAISDSIKGTTGLRNISLKHLVAYKLLFPPLPQQRKIAKILTTVDNLIEKTESLIAKYQSIKQGMMHDLFTRGVDANGKLRPQQSAAPELYKQSELGWIPKDWEVERLGEVAAKIQDGTHFSPKSTQGSFRYVTSKNIRFGYLDLENSCWISSKEHQEIFKRCDVSYGDVLLTKDGANTGNACLNTIHEPFSLLSSVAVVRMDGVHSISEFVLHYFLSPFCQQRFRDLMSGNAITRLTLIKIKSLILPFPKLLEQKLISKRFYHLDVVIKNKEAHLTKLKSIKTALMQDILTGKVQVAPDAEDKE